MPIRPGGSGDAVEFLSGHRVVDAGRQDRRETEGGGLPFPNGRPIPVRSLVVVPGFSAVTHPGAERGDAGGDGDPGASVLSVGSGRRAG